MPVPTIEDNRFNPQMAALAMPSDKTNPLSALGDGLVKWGDKYNANQLFDLTKQKTQKELEAADLGIEKTKQDIAFNSEYNPLRLQDAELSIAGKKTHNKLQETQATDAEWSLDDKLASKNIYGLLKTLDPKSRELMLKDNAGFDYTDPVTGRVVSITPAHLQAAKSMWDNEELNKKKVNADIYQSNAQAKAALTTANTSAGRLDLERQIRNDELALKKAELAYKYPGGDIGVNMTKTSVKDVAGQAGRMSTIGQALGAFTDSYTPKGQGWFDNGVAKVIQGFGGGSTQNADKHYEMTQQLEKLKSAAIEIYGKGGKPTNADLERIDKMLPSLSYGNEKQFRNGMLNFVNEVIATAKARKQTYNPNDGDTPSRYQALDDSIADLEAIRPVLAQKLDPDNWDGSDYKFGSKSPDEKVNAAKNQQGYIPAKTTTSQPQKPKTGVQSPVKSNIPYDTYKSLVGG